MSTIVRITAAAVIALAAAAPAVAGGDLTAHNRGGAREALRDSLGALLTARDGSASVRVGRCAPSRRRRDWTYCRARVSGTARCRVRMMVRDTGDEYVAYATRLRCR